MHIDVGTEASACAHSVDTIRYGPEWRGTEVAEDPGSRSFSFLNQFTPQEQKFLELSLPGHNLSENSSYLKNKSHVYKPIQNGRRNKMIAFGVESTFQILKIAR